MASLNCQSEQFAIDWGRDCAVFYPQSEYIYVYTIHATYNFMMLMNCCIKTIVILCRDKNYQASYCWTMDTSMNGTQLDKTIHWYQKFRQPYTWLYRTMYFLFTIYIHCCVSNCTRPEIIVDSLWRHFVFMCVQNQRSQEAVSLASGLTPFCERKLTLCFKTSILVLGFSAS